MLKIKISTTNLCNYWCSYCEASKRTKDQQLFFINPRQFINIYKFIKENFTNEFYCFTGGEPTLNPFLYKLVKITKNEKNIIYTNFSINPTYWEKFKEFKNIKLLISYHSDWETLDNFKKKMNIFLNYNIDYRIVFINNQNDHIYNALVDEDYRIKRQNISNILIDENHEKYIRVTHEGTVIDNIIKKEIFDGNIST